MLNPNFSTAQYLSTVTTSARNYPATAWSEFWIVYFDGQTLSGNTQYLSSNGAFQTAGSVQLAYFSQTGTIPNKMGVYFGTSNAIQISGTTAMVAGTTYLISLESDGAGLLYMRSCPLQTGTPTDGSAVVAEGTPVAFSGAYSGGLPRTLLDRADHPAPLGSTGRGFDQSVCRFGRYEGTLSNFDLARLASGKELPDIGKSAAMYVKLADVSDITDRGSYGATFAVTGSPTTGTEPAFGYTPPAAIPVVVTAPVVNPATAGQVATFTTGAATNSPTSSTQQWIANGADISGATGATYTPPTAGVALAVRQVFTNGSGPSLPTTSAAVTVAVAPTVTFDVDMTALNERVYQRVNGVADIAMTGTYDVAPASVEAQIYAANGSTVLVPWFPLTSLVNTSGAWTATMTAPQTANPNMYRAALRSKSAGGAVLTTTAIKANLFAVGDVILHCGSSSSAKWFEGAASGTYTPAANVRMLDALVNTSAPTWRVIATPYNGCAVYMANEYAIKSGVAIGMINAGVGGTTLAQWLSLPNIYWTALVASVDATRVNGIAKLAAFVTSVGSNDAALTSGTDRPTSIDAHATKLRLFASRIRALTDQSSLLHVISGTNGRSAGTPVPAQYNYVRGGEKVVGSEDYGLYLQTVDLPVDPGDNIHLTSTGFGTSAQRQAAGVNSVLYSSGAELRGPKIVSMVYKAAAGLAYINFEHGRAGTDYTTAAALTGFDCSDDSGALTIASAAKITASCIELTLNRTIAGTLVVTHLAGNRPTVTGQVLDNSTVPLPLEVELTMVPRASIERKLQAVVMADGRLGKLTPGDTLTLT